MARLVWKEWKEENGWGGGGGGSKGDYFGESNCNAYFSGQWETDLCMFPCVCVRVCVCVCVWVGGCGWVWVGVGVWVGGFVVVVVKLFGQCSEFTSCSNTSLYKNYRLLSL